MILLDKLQLTLNIKQMRLIDLKEAISESKELFHYSTSNNNGIFYIKELTDTREALKILMNAHFFSHEEKELLSPIVNSTGQVVSYSDSTTYGKTIELLKGTFFSIGFMFNWFCANMQEYDKEDQNLINIKLPNCIDFQSLEIFSKTMSGAISLVSTEVPGGKFEIKQFDHGSFWIIVSVGAAIGLIGKIINFALEIAQKVCDIELAKKVNENAGLSVDSNKKLINYRDQLINELAEKSASDVHDEFFKDNDEERKQRLRESIKDISSLITEGVAFQPSLKASKESTKDFPQLSKYASIVDEMKKLMPH